MKTRQLTIVILSLWLSSNSFSQSTSIDFLDEDFFQCDREDATYRRDLVPANDSVYSFTDYILDGEKLYQKGSVKATYGGRYVFIDGPKVSQKVYYRYQGLVTRFFKNGNIDFEGNFDDNLRTGVFDFWYSSGVKKGEFFYDTDLDADQEYLVNIFYDSIGNQTVINGTGSCFELYENEYGEGSVKNGLKTGRWTGYFWEERVSYAETYRKGKIVKGKSDYNGFIRSYEVLNDRPVYIKDGDAGMYRFLGKNIKYPKRARKLGVEGRVFVQFVVDKDGNTIDTSVPKGIMDECDEEALRVVSLLKWKPGRFRGQNAKIRMVLPVVFRLN